MEKESRRKEEEGRIQKASHRGTQIFTDKKM